MTAWLIVGGCAVSTAAIRAAGPVLLGGRELPPRVTAVIALLAPALLAALVVTDTLSEGREYSLDARALGLAVAALALAARAPLLVTIGLAAGTAAAVRALG